MTFPERKVAKEISNYVSWDFALRNTLSRYSQNNKSLPISLPHFSLSLSPLSLSQIPVRTNDFLAENSEDSLGRRWCLLWGFCNSLTLQPGVLNFALPQECRVLPWTPSFRTSPELLSSLYDFIVSEKYNLAVTCDCFLMFPLLKCLLISRRDLWT